MLLIMQMVVVKCNIYQVMLTLSMTVSVTMTSNRVDSETVDSLPPLRQLPTIDMIQLVTFVVYFVTKSSWVMPTKQQLARKVKHLSSTFIAWVNGTL